MAGTVRVERALHEFDDCSLDLGPTKNRDPSKVFMPSSVMWSSRTTSTASSAPRATLLSSRVRRVSGCARALQGHLKAGKRVGLARVRFHDLRHFASIMFGPTGASTKELMNRGGWKSVTMAMRYKHASKERDALLAQALNA